MDCKVLVQWEHSVGMYSSFGWEWVRDFRLAFHLSIFSSFRRFDMIFLHDMSFHIFLALMCSIDIVIFIIDF